MLTHYPLNIEHLGFTFWFNHFCKQKGWNKEEKNFSKKWNGFFCCETEFWNKNVLIEWVGSTPRTENSELRSVSLREKKIESKPYNWNSERLLFCQQTFSIRLFVDMNYSTGKREAYSTDSRPFNYIRHKSASIQKNILPYETDQIHSTGSNPSIQN